MVPVLNRGNPRVELLLVMCRVYATVARKNRREEIAAGCALCTHVAWLAIVMHFNTRVGGGGGGRGWTFVSDAAILNLPIASGLLTSIIEKRQRYKEAKYNPLLDWYNLSYKTDYYMSKVTYKNKYRANSLLNPVRMLTKRFEWSLTDLAQCCGSEFK